jgi:hypothetical protein
VTMGRRGCSGAREVVMIAWRDEVVGVLTNDATCKGATKMATRQCSIEAAGGALMERWFRA